MTELEAKKKLLAAESDVYREMLKLEAHNVRLYSTKTKQKLTSAGMLSPLLMNLIPWVTGRRRFGWREIGTLAVVGWKWYRRFSEKGSWSDESEPQAESPERKSFF